MTYMAVVEYVQAGVNLLDKAYPGWEAEIDLTTFDIASSRCCILGQLYNHYSFGKSKLGIVHGVDYGFSWYQVDTGLLEIAELDAQWREVITKRRIEQLKSQQLTGVISCS